MPRHTLTAVDRGSVTTVQSLSTGDAKSFKRCGSEKASKNAYPSRPSPKSVRFFQFVGPSLALTPLAAAAAAALTLLRRRHRRPPLPPPPQHDHRVHCGVIIVLVQVVLDHLGGRRNGRSLGGRESDREALCN